MALTDTTNYPHLPSDSELLADPCVSYWLKDRMRETAQRDVLDAYYDALLLAKVLRRRLDVALGGPIDAPVRDGAR